MRPLLRAPPASQRLAGTRGCLPGHAPPPPELLAVDGCPLPGLEHRRPYHTLAPLPSIATSLSTRARAAIGWRAKQRARPPGEEGAYGLLRSPNVRRGRWEGTKEKRMGLGHRGWIHRSLEGLHWLRSPSHGALRGLGVALTRTWKRRQAREDRRTGGARAALAPTGSASSAPAWRRNTEYLAGYRAVPWWAATGSNVSRLGGSFEDGRAHVIRRPRHELAQAGGSGDCRASVSGAPAFAWRLRLPRPVEAELRGGAARDRRLRRCYGSHRRNRKQQSSEHLTSVCSSQRARPELALERGCATVASARFQNPVGPSPAKATSSIVRGRAGPWAPDVPISLPRGPTSARPSKDAPQPSPPSPTSSARLCSPTTAHRRLASPHLITLADQTPALAPHLPRSAAWRSLGRTRQHWRARRLARQGRR